MRNPGRALASLALSVTLFAGPAGAQDGFRVIVNPTNPVAALSEPQLSRLFLKKTLAWPSGLAVVAVDQERTSDVRRAFSQKIHDKDSDAVVSHWQTMVFSGRDTPPPIKATDAAVVEFVRANPGAIGYVSEAAELGGVKLVAVRK
jgi:ABC-type phosphate transport system substrate-binding protein